VNNVLGPVDNVQKESLAELCEIVTSRGGFLGIERKKDISEKSVRSNPGSALLPLLLA